MKTTVGTAHRHKTKSRLWYDLTDVDSGSPHTHEIDLSAYDAEMLSLRLEMAELRQLVKLYPPDSQLRYVPTPSVQMPGYLGSIIDPTFGTKITRISNVHNMAPRYSKVQCWNSDGSLLLLDRIFRSQLLDGRTYALLNPSFGGMSESHWSPTDPRVLYGTSGKTFQYEDPLVDMTRFTLHTFTEYTSVGLGAQGNFSNDGRYASMYGTASPGNVSIFVYDIIADAVVATKTGFTTTPHAITMSQSGDYVIVGWAGNGTGPQQGTWLYSRALGTPIRQIYASTSHADAGYDTAGHEVWVTGLGSVDTVNTMYMFRLDTNERTQILPDWPALHYQHTSCRNTGRPGWAYLSVYDTTAFPTGLGNDQIVAVKLDGSKTVEVFGHEHHGSIPTTVYATPSKDGRRVLFGSEWGASNIYAYIAEAA